MRKCLLATGTLLLLVFAAQAQIPKGSFLLGGSISGSSSRQSSSLANQVYKQRSFSFSPAVGFVTADNKVWGLSLSTSLQNTKGSSEPADTRFGATGGAVFHRRYLTLGKGFYLFGQAAAGYFYNRQKNETPDNTMSRTARTDVVSVSIYPGVTYAVSKNFHLELGLNELLSLSYTAQNETTVNGGITAVSKSRNTGFGTNLSAANPVQLGFRFLL